MLYDIDDNIFISLVQDGCINTEEYKAFLSRARSDGISEYWS